MNKQPDEDLELQHFLKTQQLPQHYLSLVTDWYAPLAEEIASFREQARRPLLVGINGGQGSGKSTLGALLANLLTRLHGLNTIAISIDDFYLGRISRRDFAASVHPLLQTRGVPGTHDVPLMRAVIASLMRGDGEVALPQFDKASDDCVPAAAWDVVKAPVDLVVLDGWCLGVPAQDDDALIQPVNQLESEEDPDAIWRRYVNRKIQSDYEPFYREIDILVMLQAPSFDCVFDWRLEQEKKLKAGISEQGGQSASNNRLMTASQLQRFIQHYQRLMEHAIRVLPAQAHYLFELDALRNVTTASRPVPVRL